MITLIKYAIFSTFVVMSASTAATPIYFETGNKLSDDPTSAAFSGSIGLQGNELTISLTNNSDDSNGGYITAFAFNNPGISITPRSKVSLSTSSSSNFTLLGAPIYTDDDIKAKPTGYFDFGASTGTSWSGGGDPSRGIAIGQTEIFTFNFTDVGDLTSLTTQDFINSVTSGEFLALRFKGFDDEGSSKYGAAVSQVPVPAAVWLFGSSLLGLICFSRRQSTFAIQA